MRPNNKQRQIINKQTINDKTNGKLSFDTIGRFNEPSTRNIIKHSITDIYIIQHIKMKWWPTGIRINDIYIPNPNPECEIQTDKCNTCPLWEECTWFEAVLEIVRYDLTAGIMEYPPVAKQEINF